MSKQIKLVRGQLRQITQELLPSIMSEELKNAAYNQIKKEIEAKLHHIEANIKESLERIEKRQKDMHDFTIREMMSNVQVSNKE